MAELAKLAFDRSIEQETAHLGHRSAEKLGVDACLGGDGAVEPPWKVRPLDLAELLRREGIGGAHLRARARLACSSLSSR